MEAAGLLGCGLGINECQPGKRRWEGSQDTKACGAWGAWRDWPAVGHAGSLGVEEVSKNSTFMH